ncbi:MAG: leucine-rich repeat protein [Eubacteriales bacterium]
MVFTLLPAGILTASALNENGFEYEVGVDDTATITGYTGLGGNVTIPATLGGYPVTTIGDFAFSCCDLLTTVTISDGVTTILSFAFSGCWGMTSVTIPGSVSFIGEAAFLDCRVLTQINVSETNLFYSSLDGVLFDFAKTSLIQYPACKAGAFYAIPYGVTSIGDSAFDFCMGLSSVVIPDCVTEIGVEAFYDCKWLESVTILNNNTEVFSSYGNPVFFGCDSLTVYCYANSNFIDYNEQWNGIPCSIITDFIDEGVTVQAAATVVPSDTELTVTPIAVNDFDTNATIALAVQNEGSTAPVISAAYEISLFDINQTEIQPNGNIQIKLPIPHDDQGKKIVIMHILDNGSVETLTATISADGQFAIFETNSLSDFVLLAGTNAPVAFTTTSAIGKAGNNVTVSVNIAADSASGTGTIYLPYDDTKLEVVSAVAGPALAGVYSEINSTSNPIILGYIYDDPEGAGFNVGGTILTVTYKIKAGTADGVIHVEPTVFEFIDTALPQEHNLSYTFDYGNIVVDNTVPEVTGVTDGISYKVSKLISFNDLNGVTATLSSETLDAVNFTSGSTVSDEGSYTLVVIDPAGNATTVHFVIDKTAPGVTGISNGFFSENKTICLVV